MLIEKIVWEFDQQGFIMGSHIKYTKSSYFLWQANIIPFDKTVTMFVYFLTIP